MEALQAERAAAAAVDNGVRGLVVSGIFVSMSTEQTNAVKNECTKRVMCTMKRYFHLEIYHIQHGTLKIFWQKENRRNVMQCWPVNDADLGGSGGDDIQGHPYHPAWARLHCTKSWARDGPEIDALKAAQRRQINLSKQKYLIGC